MINMKPGDFDIFVKLMKAWAFDRYIRIRNSNLQQRLSERAFLTGDLTSILPANVNMSMLLQSEDKKRLGSIPENNSVAVFRETGTHYVIRKGAVATKLPRIHLSERQFALPAVNTFEQIGTETNLTAKECEILKRIAKNQNFLSLYLDHHDELYLIKNAAETEFAVEYSPMDPETEDQPKPSPKSVLLSFYMQQLIGHQVTIRIFQEPSSKDPVIGGVRFWGQFEMEIASGLSISLYEQILNAPQRLSR